MQPSCGLARPLAITGEPESAKNRSALGVRGRISDDPDDFLIERAPTAPDDDSTPEFGERGQRLVRAGEFVVGYSRQNPNFPRRASRPAALGSEPSAIAPEWARNGSFLVFRRLPQNVALLQIASGEQASRSRGELEL
jgi:hypothetical protein